MADSAFSLDRFLDLPRVQGLAAAADGSRVVVEVARRDPSAHRFVPNLEVLDPSGGAAPRRLTRSSAGESAARFAPDGSLLFLSARGAGDGDDPREAGTTGLWRLPAGPGEAQALLEPPGGVDAFAVADDAATVVAAVQQHPGSATFADDEALERSRRDQEVTAQLFTSYPMRYWDAWLGPRHRRYHLVGDEPPPTPLAPGADAPRALDGADFTLTPDGTTVVSGWWRRPEDPREAVRDLVAIDVASGEVRVLAADRAFHEQVAVAPEGSAAVCVRTSLGDADHPSDVTLWFVDLATGAQRDLLPRFDLRPVSATWTRDGAAVLFTADDDGHHLPYRVEVDSGRVRRLADEGAFSHLSPTDGPLFALRSAIDAPPHVVALDDAREEPARWRVVADLTAADPPTRLERVAAVAGDGARVPGWLVLPQSADADAPAPLVVFVHGGPVASWSGWHWRWCPHVLADAGYAVLLPDPALSTGYGQEHLRRGWGRWGDAPYTDVLALTDVVLEHPAVDRQRPTLAGGSFGGYMANWVAGHTDRFAAIVTHASLWNLEAFHGTTDLGPWWEHEFGDRYRHPERFQEWSPHRFVDRIKTPMLVVHGERDYRVPISEALALVTDLARHGHRPPFLYYPDEHHWVLKPANVRLWYATVLAFLDHHVHGRAFAPPPLLAGASPTLPAESQRGARE